MFHSELSYGSRNGVARHEIFARLVNKSDYVFVQKLGPPGKRQMYTGVYIGRIFNVPIVII